MVWYAVYIVILFAQARNPFSVKNKDLSDEEMEERLNYYDIPTDLPLVVQISRLDRWNDPEGVIGAFKLARKEIDVTLVLLGNIAVDDPEGPKVYDSRMAARDEQLIILSKEDTALVNTLQRRATVVLQKSIREGLGLTVAEAMGKGTPVVGGIRHQIEEGSDGFLVSSIEEAADRIVQLVKDETLHRELGQKAKQKVKNHFLLTRLLEQHLDLFNSLETVYCLKTQ